METIILVSVISTLGVVALFGSIAVAFKRLDDKVDVNEFISNTDNIISGSENNDKDLHRRIDDLNDLLDQRSEDCFRSIDSRCDKLHDLIKNN
jgi:peptidoglycan hydrolase CwlO-like protein